MTEYVRETHSINDGPIHIEGDIVDVLGHDGITIQVLVEKPEANTEFIQNSEADI